jgi:ABC-type oligopeptide transport system substrate-binding subunit
VIISRLFKRHAISALLAGATALAAPVAVQAQQNVLKVVMHSDLKIVDPIWTTAYITRNHGYMIYDTLFAMDAKGDIKPQMVEKYSVSPDNLTWTFTLRPGLVFHDDKPVTSDDVIASLKRWGARDCARPEAADLREGVEGRRRAHLHHRPELADRPDAARAGQAVLERALHHAQAGCRHQPQRADQGVHRFGPVRLQGR